MPSGPSRYGTYSRQYIPDGSLHDEGKQNGRNRSDDLADGRNEIEERGQKTPQKWNVKPLPPTPDEYQDAGDHTHHSFGNQIGVDLPNGR